MRPTTAVVLAWWACGCGASHAPPDLPADAGMPDADGGPCVDPAICPEICERDPEMAGCPCDASEPEDCYHGAPGTAGVGICRAGTHVCALGTWGPCDGEVLPTTEVCDEVDDDCDGLVDEGVTNECGNCGFDCQVSCVGDGKRCVPWDVDGSGAGGTRDCEGPRDRCVTLPGGPRAGVLWVASPTATTASKIDTALEEETARYLTSDDPLAAPTPIAVDFDGNAFVANPAEGSQGSVTAIANECEDVDGDGVIETSSGGGDVLAWGSDECVVWNVELGCAVGGEPEPGPACGVPRALAVQDKLGLDGIREPRLWVGIQYAETFVELDRDDGEATGEEARCECRPWDAQVDRDEILWATCAFGPNLCRFDTQRTDDSENVAAIDPVWGIAIDADGRIWTGGGGLVYDPVTENWDRFAVASADVATHGPWTWTGQVTSRVDVDTLEATRFDADSFGIAVDRDERVWGIPYLVGHLDVVDPESLEVDTVLDDCGGDCLPPLQTYGDPGGDQLREALGAAQGTYRHVLEGCENGTNWLALVHRADFPPASRIEWRVRGAYELADLGAAEWIAFATSPADASPILILDDIYFEHMQFMEVEATLVASDEGPPVLWMFGGEYECFVGL